MNKLSFTSKFFRADDSVIYLRITVNRIKAEISTKRKVETKKWNPESQKAKGNAELNSYLIYIQSEITKIHTRLISENKEVSAKNIKDIFLGRDEKSISLLSYINDHINEIAQLTTHYKPSTIKRYETIRRHLEEFLAKADIEAIKLNKFDLKLISQFDYFLKVNKKISLNTSAKYLKLLKAIFLKALRLELIDKNPFANFIYKTVEVNKEFLTPDELSSLEETKLPNESLEKVRDIFVFSVYTGLRFSDAFELKPSDVKKEKDGQYWLSIKKIIKTAKPLRIPLLNKALKIVDKYKIESEITNKLLTLISNQKTNAYLKVIADLTDIRKNLTHHCARHTFATTVTLSNKVPIEVVSNLLGHSSIKSTQIYAKITDNYLKSIANSLNKKLK